jgi:hypothetical protein
MKDEDVERNNSQKRLNIVLSDVARKKLDSLTEKRHTTSSQVIRQAIQTEDFLQTELEEGSKILIQKKDGSLREVVLNNS